MTDSQIKYWRSLDELAQSEDFKQALDREFPEGADSVEGVDRRRFLQVMGASVGLASASSCRWEKTTLEPFAERPENRVPGVPNHYATSMEIGGVAEPLVLTSYDGRPVKVEGNELHPESLGAASTFAQAAILELYDPDRSTNPTEGGAARTTEQFEAALGAVRASHAAKRGAGLAFLSRVTNSPAIAEAQRRLKSDLPQAEWFEYEALQRDGEIEGARMAFGRPVRTHFDLSKANRIACFDADLLGDHPGSTRMTRAFSLRRRPEGGSYDGVNFEGAEFDSANLDGATVMNRLYVVEARHTTTGASADHRLPLRAEQVGAALAALEAALVAKGLAVPEAWGSASPAPTGTLFGQDSRARAFVNALADDLYRHRGTCVVAVGGTQPRGVHALAHRINALLGNVGKTVLYTDEPNAERTSSEESIETLVEHMNGNQIETLVVLDGNPIYDAPKGLDFGSALGRVKNSIHIGLYRNETARVCGWHAPLAHFLESWGDALAWDGSYCVVQPLIRPIFAGRSALEVTSFFATGSWSDAQELARAGCTARLGALSDKQWQLALHDGMASGTASVPVTPAPQRVSALSYSGAQVDAAMPANGALELVLYGDPCVHDGRFGNNAWLQELPEFMTKLTWDNAALMSPATTDALGVTTGDMVTLTISGRTLDTVVYAMPGQAAGSVALALGYGRTGAGAVGGDSEKGVPAAGFDAYALTSSRATGHETGLTVSAIGRTYPLAMTADHHLIDTTGMNERDGEWLDPSQSYPDKTFEMEGADGEMTAVALTTPTLVRAYNKKAREGSRVAELVRSATHSEFEGYLEGVADDGGRESVVDKLHAGHGEDVLTTQDAHADDAAHAEDEHGDDHGDGHGHGPHYVDPNKIKRIGGPELLSLWERHSYDGHRWGMSIDLSSCVGCNACVVACQSENNIPVVGKEQVLRGREMHWLRIDRYFSGDPESPKVVNQPVGCIQCEDAPCEQVCPVAATVHSDEGLNDMVYNRCIGTRYCSNNCPIKVRRFNYFNYHRDLKGGDRDLEKMSFNPEVTVRARGVMEKCTYCVQRIQAKKIVAKVDDRRPIRDGEIVTACQQTCPADAIRFGDLADESSVVSKAHASERSYDLLKFLNIRPRTAYLARITNPNPLLVEA